MKKLILKKLLAALVCVAFVLGCIDSSYAQKPASDKEEQAMRDAITNQTENNFTEEFKKAAPKKIRQHLYEPATLATLSYLQWALSVLDIKDNDNIDYFMKITECALYKRFKADEFEWDRIRSATRDFIKQNKNDFPVRFELVIPLKLGEYNKEKSYFDVQKKSQIKSVRLFELLAKDAAARDLCGDQSIIIGKIFKGVLLELSRPFSMTFVPVEAHKAEKIIEEKNLIYQDRLLKMSQPKFDQQQLYDLRDAILVLYTKIFTYKGPHFSRDPKYFDLAQVLAVVEGYEVYEDVNRKNLLYSRNYITKRDEKKANENLKKEIEMVKKRLNGKGILQSEG